MRIVKGPCLIDIGPNPFQVRAVGEHIINNMILSKPHDIMKNRQFPNSQSIP